MPVKPKKDFHQVFKRIEQKGMTFEHDFGYSFPLLSSLLKKGKKKKGEWIEKIVIKSHMPFCSIVQKYSRFWKPFFIINYVEFFSFFFANRRILYFLGPFYIFAWKDSFEKVFFFHFLLLFHFNILKRREKQKGVIKKSMNIRDSAVYTYSFLHLEVLLINIKITA